MLSFAFAAVTLAAAETNLFANAGYFAPGRKTPFDTVVRDASAKVVKDPLLRVGLAEGTYGEGTALFAVTNDSGTLVRIWTKDLVPVCGDLMVFEVKARAAGMDFAPFSVLGVTPRHKFVAHKNYRLTPKWRTYVAILPVPADADPKERFWRGYIDVPARSHVEIGHVKLYPAVHDERIAGLANDVDWANLEIALAPTLDDVRGPAPSTTAFVSSQVGNGNPVARLATRRSDEIAGDNILGAAYHGEGIVLCPVSGRRYTRWSPWWTIVDDDVRRQSSFSTFSTHPLLLAATNAELTVRLAAPVPLAQVRITTREGGLGGFPCDWHAGVSSDGVTFRTVHTVTNFNAKGVRPSFALDGSPVRAIRLYADRLRPESKYTAYFQLDRVEALDAAGVNHALVSKGATVEAPQPMGLPILDRATFLEDAIVNCGIKTVLAGVSVMGGTYTPVASRDGGCVPGSASFENLTANLRYLKAHGVKTYMRLSWGNTLFGKSLFDLKTSAELEAFKAEYIGKIAPYVKAWKGLVACYPLGGEENQYLNLRSGRKLDIPFFKRAYREMIIAASEAIHAIDPGAKTSVTSALFDFGWTEEHLKNGMAQALDEVGVDVYRENDPLGSYPEECTTFMVDGRRGLESERLYARTDDEVKGFRRLLDRYNPRLTVAWHEMAVRVGKIPQGCCSTPEGQAKFALRSYVMNHFFEIGPSCWWSFNGSADHGSGTMWGVIRGGEKLPAWYAMQRFAALFDSSWKPLAEAPLVFAPADRRYYSYAFARGDERLAACWAAVSMRDGNTGKIADVFVPGSFAGSVPEVDCIDLLSGHIQKANVEKAAGGFRVRNVIMRDYPLVFRYREAPGA